MSPIRRSPAPVPSVPRRAVAAALLRRLAAAMLLALGLAGAPAAGGADEAGAPGSLDSAEVMPGAPAGAVAYRVVYRSRGLSGETIPVSGVIVVPPGPVPPGGRPVVAWAHPTTGVASRCAPSLTRGFFGSVQGLAPLLARGYVVAATDYPGLGTPEVHPYLVGASEARAVLDSVRAARRLPGSGAGADFAVWGHSQGGQAALFTGLLARDYAPELRLAGVAAAAPVTDLAALMTDDQGTGGGSNITAMTLWSWARVYGAPVAGVLRPEAIPVVDVLAEACIERWFDVFVRRAPAEVLERGFLQPPGAADLQPWKKRLAENSPGPLPPDVPAFIVQGTADELVRMAVTNGYVGGLCRNAVKVRYRMLPGIGHAYAAYDSAAEAVDWMAARFAGAPAPDDCNP